MDGLHLELSKTNIIGDTEYNVSVMLVMILRVAMCKMSSSVRHSHMWTPFPHEQTLPTFHPVALSYLRPILVAFFCIKSSRTIVHWCLHTYYSIYLLQELFGVLNFNRTNSWNFLGNVSSTMNRVSKEQMTSLGSKCPLRVCGCYLACVSCSSTSTN